MRPNQNNKNRQRGRNNNGGRKHVNPLSRNFESNGPDVKVRGNAAHIAEKYLQLARDAQSSGDPVLAENYLQHAEHYFRIVAAAQQAQQYRDQPGAQAPEVDEDDDFPPINDRFASPEPAVPFRSQPQPGNGEQPGFAAAEGGSEEGGEPSQPQGEAATAEDGQSAAGQQGEGDGHRRRDRNRRRRGRGPAEGGQGGEDPASSPQPEVALPAFLTAGGNTPAE
ncbi:MAG: DUF4167 domain-containing protein [Proteobacteria bacterium]|jgi:hypothetical protein|nr:DUF4167 domain-containing protein [Pseudomonadota bacterium]